MTLGRDNINKFRETNTSKCMKSKMSGSERWSNCYEILVKFYITDFVKKDLLGGILD